MTILEDLLAIPAVKRGLRVLNWIFVIGLILFGLVLSVTFLKTGLIFVFVGILISPHTQDFLQKHLHINFPPSNKLITVLLGCVMAIVSLNYEDDEQLHLVKLFVQNAWLDSNNEEQVEKFRIYLEKEEFEARKTAYLAKRHEYITELQFLYKKGYYQSVITQGAPHVEFDSQVRQWVEEAKKILKQEQIKTALTEVPQLMKANKFMEAYQMVASLDEPQLERHKINAKKEVDKTVNQLRSSYEKGHYKEVLTKGTPYMEFDCRIKRLVHNAKKAQAKRQELRGIKKAVKKVSQLMKARQYEPALNYAKKSPYSKSSELQELIKRAEFKLKKEQEKKILAILRNIPATQVEANLREYNKLVKLFPDKEKYKRKLEYYKQKLAELRKQPPLLLSQEDYGDKWPFTVPSGELECIPPGIITFKANNKTYAVNRLANSRGYRKIDEIWKTQSATGKSQSIDIGQLINKGLGLCTPR